MNKHIKIILPFIFLFALLGLLARELFFAKKGELPSAMIGEKVPSFSLPTLSSTEKTLSNKNLGGHVILINVWATWCYACNYEHPMLLKIKNEYHVPIYGIDYKDNADEARQWLAKHGNPYEEIGSDFSGDVAIDFGVYGTPETFVISPQGRIVYRHVGVIDQETWDNVIYPLVKKYDQTR